MLRMVRKATLIDSKETYTEQIEKAESFLIFDQQNEILGYIVSDHREKYIDDEYKIWFDYNLKDIYYNSPYASTLDKIAVSKSSSHKGVATTLLAELERNLKEKGIKYLFSIVTVGPIENIPSMQFHEKNKFKRVAIGKPRTLFSLDNYSGVLLYKKI